MDRHIKDYLETGRALRQKYDEMKFGKLSRQVELAERFKPITDSLHKLNENMSNKENAGIEKSQSTVLEKLLAPEKKVDKNFGIRQEKNGLFVGNSRITVTPDSDVLLESDQTVYKGTPGLWELLTAENPQYYDNKDLSNYEQLVLRSYAYKRNNDRHSSYQKAPQSIKYRNLIKPMLMKYHIIKNIPPIVEEKNDKDGGSDEEYYDAKKGFGLQKFSTNQPVEYVYWNTIDELVERLCHLWGEVQSGNTNPVLLNEIINIIQEFKEL